jgi:hypothetical protein
MPQPTTTARYEIVVSEPAGELLVDNERGLVWQLSDYFTNREIFTQDTAHELGRIEQVIRQYRLSK